MPPIPSQFAPGGVVVQAEKPGMTPVSGEEKTGTGQPRRRYKKDIATVGTWAKRSGQSIPIDLGRLHEWAANTRNGFSGGLQFTPSTWRAYGGQGDAHTATRAQQITVAERVLADQGWAAWPACSAKLGLR
jgi:hypothetical protein